MNEHEIDDGTNCRWRSRNNPQRLDKGNRRLGNKRTRGDHLDNRTAKISQNTEKSPEDFRTLDVT